MKVVALLLVLFAAVAFAGKISPNLKPNAPSFDFFIKLKDNVNHKVLKSKTKTMTWSEQGDYVFRTLTSFHTVAAASIKKELNNRGLKFTSYWVANAIFVEGASRADLEFFATRKDVSFIEDNQSIHLLEPIAEKVEKNLAGILEIQDNVAYHRAPEAWAKGSDGKGVNVCHVDTGVQYDHTGLANNYAGKTSSGVNHNYVWYDGFRSGGSPQCRGPLKEPCDDNGHGTHCAGTSVGYGRGIGLAPKAQFSHCRALSRGSGTLQTLMNCIQWLAAPTDVDGNNPNPQKRPHVSSHSYGFPSSAGPVFAEAVKSVVDAGVIFVAAAGNSGSRCGSLRGDPAALKEVFSVGALNRNSDNAASFSSRGPTPAGLVKPEIAAVGAQVVSSFPGNAYRALSGTSMACPAVAGAIAGLYTEGTAGAALRGKPLETQKLVESTAERIDTTTCGGGFPNNVYGHGKMDMLDLVNAAK